MQASVCHLQGQPDGSGVVRVQLATGYRGAYPAVGVSPEPLAPRRPRPVRCLCSHACTLLATIPLVVAICVTVWCGLDPGVWWPAMGRYARTPCSTTDVNLPMLAGVLVPGLYALYLLLASCDRRLVKMVSRRRDASKLASSAAALDAVPPQVHAWIQLFHIETRINYERRPYPFPVCTHRADVLLPLAGWANLAGFSWADAPKSFFASEVDFRLALQLDAAGVASQGACINKLLAAMGHLDELWEVGWSVALPGLPPHAQTVNPAWEPPGACGCLLRALFTTCGFRVCTALLLAWPWLMLVEAFTQRTEVIVGKVALAAGAPEPVLPGSPSAAAAGAGGSGGGSPLTAGAAYPPSRFSGFGGGSGYQAGVLPAAFGGAGQLSRSFHAALRMSEAAAASANAAAFNAQLQSIVARLAPPTAVGAGAPFPGQLQRAPTAPPASAMSLPQPTQPQYPAYPQAHKQQPSLAVDGGQPLPPSALGVSSPTAGGTSGGDGDEDDGPSAPPPAAGGAGASDPQ
jgi:hypothetical protein